MKDRLCEKRNVDAGKCRWRKPRSCSAFLLNLVPILLRFLLFIRFMCFVSFSGNFPITEFDKLGLNR